MGFRRRGSTIRRLGLAACAAIILLAVGWALWGPDRRRDRLSDDRQSDSGQKGLRPAAVADHGRLTPDVSGGDTQPQLATLALREYRPELADEFQYVDPRKDDWQSEGFNDLAAAQLNRFKSLLASRTLSSGELPALSPSFHSSPLRPARLAVVFSDPHLTVRRPADDLTTADQDLYQGQAGLRRALTDLTQPLPAADVHVELKVIGVQLEGDSPTCRLRVQLWALDETESLQQTAEWLCGWQWDGKTQLSLDSLQLAGYEEVAVHDVSAPALFADSTDAVVGGNRCFRQQLQHGIDYWRERLDWRFGLELIGAHGLAVGDVNGDGLDDLFVCETGGLPNRLFLQQPDGTAREAAAECGVDYIEPTQSALIVDLDNDGDQDLVMTSGRYVLIFQNLGQGSFERQSIHQSMSVARSMCAADYDLDGDLDIYVCGYFARDSSGDHVGLGRPMPYHDANNGVRNYLLANEGNWQFQDVTDSVGLDQNNRRFSYAAAWCDYDNDGDQDLYVANDFGRNNLYRNDKGQFVDVAGQAGVEDISAGMSVSWGDYNRDGLWDVYVGNMYSSAGNRIAYQRKFLTAGDDAARALFQRHARGNSLFENVGDGTFRDVSLDAQVNMGRWAWSSNFMDLNNDGWEDLYVANGMVTSAQDPGDL